MTKYLISTPQAGFTGVSVGVNFTDGHAEIDSETQASALRYFRAQGYGVEEVDEAPVVADEVDDEPPAELPAKSAAKPEWVAAAIARGYDAGDAEKATKEQLIELLTSEEQQA